MTPNAYMTDQAWKNITPRLCKGMRKMKGVQDSLWMVLSMDGFGSHLEGSALQIFADHMIIVVKEEGDTSQVSQDYDQTVSKNNKKFTREMLDKYKLHTTHVMNQWELVFFINTTLENVPPKSWRDSLIKVNGFPSQRRPFKTWVKKSVLLLIILH